MKVLQLIQKQQLRGVEVFTAQLSNHLEAMGHEVLMVSLVAGNDVLPFKGGIHCLNANLSRKWWDVKGWKGLAELIRSFQPDVVQANAADTLKYAVLSKQMYDWRQPLLYRNASVMSRYTTSIISKTTTRFLLRQVDQIISVSDVAARDICSTFRIAADKVCVIPVGVEPVAAHQDLFKEYQGFHIVHVGGFTFEKNHSGLLRIFGEVLKQIPEARLWLVGDGPLRNQTEQMARDLGLMESITFTGSQSNAVDYIASADVFILPSIMEGLPAVILESFYYETPVVAYAVGAIPEVLTSETGWAIAKDRESEMIQTLVHLYSDKTNEMQRRVYNAKDLVTQQYGNERIASKFNQLYQSHL